MSSSKAIQAIPAVKMFTDSGMASRVSVTKEVIIGLTLGLGAGLTWKTYHWNYKRKISEYYETLEQLEKQKASGGDE